jgi:hypothetical protein
MSPWRRLCSAGRPHPPKEAAARGAAGRMPPNGFPKDKPFG